MKKLICALLTMGFVLGLFSGCGAEQNTSATSVASVVSSAEPSTEAVESVQEPADTAEPLEPEDAESVEEETVTEEAVAEPELVLPLCEDLTTLTYWLNWTPGGLMTGYLDTLADHVAILAAEEMTNVHIEFTEVDNATASEKFQLMVAGGDYPDMVRGLIGYYNGGGSKAVEDDVIIVLNDLLEAEAPHYWNMISSSEKLRKDTATDDGDFLAVYNIDDEILPNSVAAIRQDWLEEQNLESPKTYDDYYNVLTTFKNAYNLDEPLCIPAGGQENSYLVGGYGVSGNTGTAGLFQIDGTVHCSLIEDGYRDYLEMLNQWYNEGLISKDFYSAETGLGATDTIAANVMDDKIGIFYTNYSRISTLVSSTGDENFRVVGITDAVSNAGDTNHFGVSDSLTSGINVSITTACEDPNLALQWLNFWFSEEGQLMANWGIENVSYVFDEDGNPAYTEMVSNNPDGMVMMAARTYYTMNQVPTLLIARRTFGVLTEDEAEAAEIFSSNLDGKYMMPANITVGAEAAEEATALLSDITTYADPAIIRFITGETPLDAWDDYVATIESMNISRVIEIYQDALDAYNQR